MNRKSFSIALCVIAAISCSDVDGDIFTGPSGEDDSKTWRVFSSMMSHPGDVLLFVTDDYFYLQKDAGPHVRFKPAYMKSPEWNNAHSDDFPEENNNDSEENIHSQGVILFKRYTKKRPTSCENDDTSNCDGENVEYLCSRVKLGFGSEKHLIVISPAAGHGDNQIMIEYEHASNGNPNELCRNVVLPSHGGLAHAHAVR